MSKISVHHLLTYSHVNSQVISRFELLIAQMAIEDNIQMFPFYMFVHIGGLVAGVFTLNAGPNFQAVDIGNLRHSVFHKKIQSFN